MRCARSRHGDGSDVFREVDEGSLNLARKSEAHNLVAHHQSWRCLLDNDTTGYEFLGVGAGKQEVSSLHFGVWAARHSGRQSFVFIRLEDTP